MAVLVITGTTTTGLPTIPVTAITSQLLVGAAISGTGIPAGTTVLGLVGGVLTMSANATASGSTAITITVPGYTQLIATRVQDAVGNLLASGSLHVEPTDTSNNPIACIAGGNGGAVYPGIVTVTNGAIPVDSLVPDTALTRPVNVCLRFTFKDSTGRTLPCSRKLDQPTGALFNLDTTPPNVAPQVTVQAGPPGPQGPPGVGGGVLHSLQDNPPDGVDAITGVIGTDTVFTIPASPLQIVQMFRNGQLARKGQYTFLTANTFSWTEPLSSGDTHAALVVYAS